MSAVLHRVEGGGLLFHCPGCQMAHEVRTADMPGTGPRWSWNGSMERPTFTPSILVRWTYGDPPQPRVCHSFVTDGQIQFLADCTHALAGQTVPLEPDP